LLSSLRLRFFVERRKDESTARICAKKKESKTD
jgi:hypothetical protein